jgi:hypothetical protein
MTKRKYLWIGLIVVGVMIATVVGGLGWGFYGEEIKERLNRKRFGQISWQAGQSRTNVTRIQMVDDLLRRHSFNGMTRDQVTAIIGEPDQTEYFKDWDMVYWLGPERGYMSVDSEWLVFRLDDQKKVVEHKIVRD